MLNSQLETAPDSQRKLDLFAEKPGTAVIEDIRRHIRETGRPHEWQGHTHDRPTDGEHAEFLFEYDLPDQFNTPSRRAPCPICCPDKPKYAKRGIAAWFPREGKIRLMGPDCYATVVGREQFDAAYQEMKRKEKRESDERYLIRRVALIDEHFDSLEAAIPTLEAIDRFWSRLHMALGESRRHILAVNTAGGILEVEEEVVSWDKDGTSRKKDFRRQFSTIVGYDVFKPNVTHVAPMMKGTLAALGALRRSGDEVERALEAIDDDERRRVVSMLGTNWRRAIAALDAGRMVQSFLGVGNIRTLRTWGRRADAPIQMHFDVETTDFWFGYDENRRERVPIERAVREALPVLPALMSVRNIETS